MEERRWDGEVVLTDNKKVADLEAALADARNKVVALHKPGSTVTTLDGTEYLVGADGAWRRLTPKGKR